MFTLVGRIFKFVFFIEVILINPLTMANKDVKRKGGKEFQAQKAHISIARS